MHWTTNYLSGYLTGENVRSSEFGSTTAVNKETRVSDTKQLASQQHDTVSGLQISFGSPSVEIYSPNNNCSFLNHRKGNGTLPRGMHRTSPTAYRVHNL